jgi:GNAT superfamily N-acetyltransferase
MLKISVRPAHASDSEFAYQVLERTMKSYAIETWGTWMEREARAETSADASAGRSQIIQLGAASVGLFRVDRLPAHFQLDQLFILPGYQRRGIGAQVLRAVVSEAHSQGLPVHLRVLRVNPAKAFYLCHGFSVVSETPERFFMACAPDQVATTTP